MFFTSLRVFCPPKRPEAHKIFTVYTRLQTNIHPSLCSITNLENFHELVVVGDRKELTGWVTGACRRSNPTALPKQRRNHCNWKTSGTCRRRSNPTPLCWSKAEIIVIEKSSGACRRRSKPNALPKQNQSHYCNWESSGGTCRRRTATALRIVMHVTLWRWW